MNQGVDRRILGNDAWTRLVNVVTDQQGAGHKRPGYGPLPNTVRTGSFPSRVQWLDTRQGELLARGRPAASAGPFDLSLTREWSWSPSLQFWSEVDYVTTCSTEASVITTTTYGACLPCVARTTDGVEVWSWMISNGSLPGSTGPVFLARDATTGAALRAETATGAAWVQHKSVACGAVAVLLGAPVGGATVDAIIYAPAPDTITVHGPLHTVHRGAWDACNVDATRFVFAECGPGANDLTITTHDATLATLETNTVVSALPIVFVSVAYAPGIGFKVAYAVDTGPNFDIVSTLFLDAPGLPQAYITTVVSAVPSLAYVAIGATSAGASVVVWQESCSLPCSPVHAQQLDAAGAPAGVSLVTANTLLRSKPFAVEDRLYAIASPYFDTAVPIPGIQVDNSFTLNLLMAPEPMASRGWACEGILGALCATRTFLQQVAVHLPIFPEVPSLSGVQFIAPVEKMRTITAAFAGAFEGSASFAAGVSLDLSPQQSACPQGAESSYCLARSGAQVGWYDGEQEVELSFCQFPTLFGPVIITPVVPPPGIGPILAPGGVFLYKAVYEWIDAQGNLHQSETSNPLTVTVVAGAGYTIGFNVSHLGTTRKGRPTQGDERQVQIAIFRTLLNGQIYYRLTPPNAGLINDTTTSSAAYTDDTPDTALLSNAFGQLYTSGEILDNRPLPGSRAVTAWNNRIWSASADDGKTLWFSKLGVVGEAPGFSEALTLRVDDAVDSVTAFGAMDDKLIVFTSSRMYYVSGDGPNDTGQGGAFNGPTRIASDGGCVDARSVVSYPGGVFYASPSGLYEVSRSLQVSAKGLPVLDETAGCEYLSSWLDAPNKRIYWLVEGGSTARYIRARVLVYDYAFDVWSVFIPYRGGSVSAAVPDPTLSAQCMWQGSHMWATEQLVRQAGHGLTPWLDGSSYFSGSYESPWVKMSGVAGYARTYRVTMTGKSFSTHNISMDVLSDYDENTLRQSRTWASGSLQNAPEVERVQLHLRCQLASAIKIRLYDTAPEGRPEGSGPTGGFDLASLAFEIGVRGGSPRLPSTNRG